MAKRVVGPVLGYLHRLKKVFADVAYKVELGDWLTQMYTSVELEISSRPPSTKGFVPVKIRWVTEQTFGIFNFQRRLDRAPAARITKKHQKVQKLGYIGLTAKESLTD